MYVPDRQLDPPEQEEPPDDEFVCHDCGDRWWNENLAYTRQFPGRPPWWAEDVCVRCAEAAGLHQCEGCSRWGDEETVYEIASDRGEWRCAKCAAKDGLSCCTNCNDLHPADSLKKEAGERLCEACDGEVLDAIARIFAEAILKDISGVVARFVKEERMRITRTDGTEIGEFASIEEAIKGEVNLMRADLRGANLRWVNLSGADLSGADLRGVNLRGVWWNDAILTNAEGAPWHFGLGRHVAIVHEGKISIGCMTETVEWWLERYEDAGEMHGYSEAEIAEYGAWIKFVAERLKLQDGDASAAQEEKC